VYPVPLDRDDSPVFALLSSSSESEYCPVDWYDALGLTGILPSLAEYTACGFERDWYVSQWGDVLVCGGRKGGGNMRGGPYDIAGLEEREVCCCSCLHWEGC
jgi:hypothetical protein